MVGLLGAVSIFGLMLKFFRQALMFLFFLFPFYYLPYYLSSLNRMDMGFAEEGFWFRAAKDGILLIIIAVWLTRLVLLGRLKARLTLVSIAMVGYLTFGLVRSLGFSLNGTLDVLRLFVEFTIFFFIVPDTFTNETQLRHLIWIWILPSVGVSILGFIEFFFGGNTVFTVAAGQTRIISTLFNPNALGWYLTWVNGLTFGLYLAANTRKARWVLLIIMGLNGATIILSGSRSSLLVMAVMLCFTLVMSRRPRVLFMLIFIFSAIVVSITVAQQFSGIILFRALSFADVTDMRNERIAETLPNVFNSPLDLLWGRGDIWEQGLEGASSLNVDAQYLNILYSGGIMGFLLLGIILLGTSRNLWRLHLRSHPLALPLLLSSFAVILIGFMGSIFILFPGALFFWSTAGLANRLARFKVTRPQSCIRCEALRK